ncbi:MAG: ABC transporter ATP-binding protein [Thermodesulfobacteriota bacterium]
MTDLVIVRNLKKYFRAKTDVASLFTRGSPLTIKAVDDVSFHITRGEILGLLGESGSGKSTVARLLVGLEKPDSGEVWIAGRNIVPLEGREKKKIYRRVQMIFQDPYESINPRFKVQETVVAPLKVQKLAPRPERLERVGQALRKAGLKRVEEYLYKYPHELSGGERQRLSIARALVVEPQLLVADEPVSMLDVSVKAGILNLLKQLSQDLGLTILYISHDLSTVKYLCDRAIIMYKGRLVEAGPAEEVIDNPLHPYAQALRAAIPVPDARKKRPRPVADGFEDNPEAPARGCRYRPECPRAGSICDLVDPELKPVSENRLAACHLYDGRPSRPALNH